MKLDYNEKKVLLDSIKVNIIMIEEMLDQNGLDEKTIKKKIDAGDYELEGFIEKRDSLRKLLKKVELINLPGASVRQSKSLDKLASKKKIKHMTQLFLQ